MGWTTRQPVGVVGMITPWNFPVAIPSWKCFPALLAGNGIVLKPSEHAPACAEEFVAALREAGVPDGLVNVVHGYAEPGQALVVHPGVRAVSFTGSVPTGRIVAAAAMATGPRLVSLELGGKNAMIVLGDADLALAADGALFGAFGTAGQRCTSLGTVLVHTDVHDAFVDAFAGAVSAARIGDPRQDVLYGPLLSDRFAQSYESYLDWISPRHRVLGSTSVGRISERAPRDGFVGEASDGLYYHPVIVDGVGPQDKLFSEETFGPVVGVCAYSSLDEAISLANLPGYGLSSAIYTTDPTEVFAFRAGVSAGMVSVNNSTSGAEAHLPFGGNRRSGNGSRQSGRWVLDQFTRWQAMNWDYSGHLQKAQMDTAVIAPDLTFRLDSAPPE
jgi:aldehyde dehydrogenase (NAD+)